MFAIITFIFGFVAGSWASRRVAKAADLLKPQFWKDEVGGLFANAKGLFAKIKGDKPDEAPKVDQ